ncbi:Rieske 2Fe-2S domain-containing protein [Yinghuangia sp. ASG 101]|uniref:Rieske (2Fe-2S) protein n=1 Tax=Yinghuangia sp. ASG 101 TaxID=2896848 RepID=UPI001E38753B|nr:Rieske 2Fe-2S domain-containing protein [Yinghuangia sp. ASG 101]UGQ09231.1 Rieske 2Fe-2S domain-containing protein [Yinghuangia sp. ASG 101]
MKVPFRRDRGARPEPVPDGVVPEHALRLGPVGDVPEGVIRRVSDHPPIAVVRHGTTIHAVEDRCPHAGALLSRGTVVGDTITCPAHHTCFRADTGRSSGRFASRALRTYPIVVVDTIAYIDPTPRAAKAAKRTACP